ncbi:MAG TPA: hypothetical protein VH518_19030 [Tepidisphaeraceae bacterium]|jgi:hypothetical protein
MSESDSDRKAAALKFVNETPFFAGMNELDRVKDEPRLLVIITHGFIELAVNTIIDETCKDGKKITDSRDFTHSTRLTLLHEMGLLSDHHYVLLNWFRKLRNEAAHEPFFKLTKDKLDIFAEDEFREPDKFFKVCSRTIADLLITFSDILGPVFMPGLVKPKAQFVLMEEVPAPEYHVKLKSDPKTISREVKH